MRSPRMHGLPLRLSGFHRDDGLVAHGRKIRRANFTMSAEVLRDCEISRIVVILGLVLFLTMGWKAWDADPNQAAKGTVSE